jgi:hypothetical protein
MVKTVLSRKLMLAAGILAALVILFSQAFEKETNSLISRLKAPKTEKQDSSREDHKVITPASTDAVTSGQAVQTPDTDANFIREIVQEEQPNSETPSIHQTFLVDFFKTLFRVYIAPQAP